jgi:hypothetical protein
LTRPKGKPATGKCVAYVRDLSRGKDEGCHGSRLAELPVAWATCR